jgi:hypothetical protein
MVVRQLEVFGCLSPFLSFGRIITKVFIRFLEHLIVTSSLFHQLHDSSPVTHPHSEVKRKVLAIDVLEDLLCFIVALEKDRNFCLLLDLLIQVLESIDQLNTIVVGIAYKCALSHLQVKFLQSCFSDKIPKTVLWALLNELNCLFQAGLSQKLTSFTQSLGFVLHKHVFDVLDFLWILQDIIQQDSLHF